jgi:uncharacterized membrane protein YidH (DUF202 family)
MGLFSTQIAFADLNGFIAKVDNTIINPLILFLFALAVVFFLYGMLEFILNQENEEKKTSGKSHMLWGIVGIAIMLGVWTILGVMLSTMNVKGVDLQKGTVQLQ